MAKSEFPVQLTERSASAIREKLRAFPGATGNVFLRVCMEAGSAHIDLLTEVDTETDLVGESFGLKIAVPRQDCAAVAGLVIDYRSIGSETGFVLKDPNSFHSRASDPGRFQLSESKLRRLQPELFVTERGFFRWLLRRRRDPGVLEYCESLASHLQTGDSRAAVVVSVAPLVVAAYTDELDCVALLRFPERLVEEFGLRVGSRLLTVNMYTPASSEGRSNDLVPGPRDTKQYSNYMPLIAEFLVINLDRVEHRKEAIREDEWQRAEEMGKEMLGRGFLPRDGRPLYCGKPSAVVGRVAK